MQYLEFCHKACLIRLVQQKKIQKLACMHANDQVPMNQMAQLFMSECDTHSSLLINIHDVRAISPRKIVFQHERSTVYS